MSMRPQHQRPSPELPHGSPTALGGLAETFSFHTSPETFVTSRALAFRALHPDIADSRTPVRAKILNRNVAVISSHLQIAHILSLSKEESNEGLPPSFVATEAYQPFMAQFYPSPNLLLADGAEHAHMRRAWEVQIENLDSRVKGSVDGVVKKHFARLVGSEIDLYDSLKSLIWKVLLSLVLGLDDSDPLFGETEKLQEDLLRGQFSLLPVSVNVRIWQSPRSKGIDAKEKLQRLILERLKLAGGSCPFHSQTAAELDEVANHILLFTSSLAVKAMASLLTAYLLNLFLFESDGVQLVEKAQALDEDERVVLLRSIALETERLSPPIVGIMRRVTRETIIPSFSDGPDIRIPRDWDAWLYFVGGGRDPKAFGETWADFAPERFVVEGGSNSVQGLAFSMGEKRCLGQKLVREICFIVAQGMLREDLKLEGEVRARGVRAWLGWNAGSDVNVEDWAGDVKQLPTQRPAKPVMVQVTKGL